MRFWSKPLILFNSFAIALGSTASALALEPEVLYQRSSPAVVSIAVPSGRTFSYGSGFITNPQGIILTNHHVVKNNQRVTVRLADGSTYQGVVISRNPQVDLALIQIQAKRRLPSLRLQLVPPKIGQRAFAIGDPKGLTRTLSDGIVSRIDGSGLIQYTATSSFGSSGGPLLDENGKVIGVVRGGVPGTNLNFAIPIAAMNLLPSQRGLSTEQQIESYILVSNLQLRQGNYQKAFSILNEAIRRYPNVAMLYTNRGAVRTFLKDYQGALNDYLRSLRIRPSSLAYLNLARIYAVAKQPQRAISAFTQAIRLNREWGESDLGEALYSRGQLQARLGQKKSAISDFQQAAKFYQQASNTEGYRSALDQITLLNAQ